MPSPTDPDKTGSELASQRFLMLEDIARELSGNVVFPTSFELALRLRRALQDPMHSIDSIARVISVEPLIASKLVQVANSAYFNPGGREVRSLPAAISRLGLDMVRSTALGIAMSQLLRSKDMAPFADLAHRLWDHSLCTASACHVIAGRLTRISPDEAMLAGLVHDIGAFYMLYRATQYEELMARPDTLKYLILQWHESIGHSLLVALGLPEDMAEAVREHDQPRPIAALPRNLAEVVHVGNLLGGGLFEWLHQDRAADAASPPHQLESYLALQQEIDERSAEMQRLLS